MKTFSISTLGCKVNQYESRQIQQLLESLGLEAAGPSGGEADLVVVNTCCVTHAASAKSRQHIRKAQKLNSHAVIAVSGCLTAVRTDELNDLDGHVHLIKHRQAIAAELRQIVSGNATEPDSQNLEDKPIRTQIGSRVKSDGKLPNLPQLPSLTSFKGHTRAFLKLQDGCDGCCTYCIIPKTRPSVQSKPVESAIEEAQHLVNAGHKEIVLTGIFLGAFGRNTVRRRNWPSRTNMSLVELLDRMAQIDGLERIRLSSLEPGDVTPELLDVFCRRSNIMPHVHLSLQSGSSRILKRMGRQYSAEDFREKISLIVSELDRPAITTDIIVGFPGETDADFQQTVELAEEVGFAKIHVFSFSRRRGTPAANMQPVVNAEVMKERSQMLRDLGRGLGRKFRSRFVGETAKVLIENVNGQVSGRSERYFGVCINNATDDCGKNELVTVRLLESQEDGMTADIPGGDVSGSKATAVPDK